jgi:hypothetical protein
MERTCMTFFIFFGEFCYLRTDIYERGVLCFALPLQFLQKVPRSSQPSILFARRTETRVVTKKRGSSASKIFNNKSLCNCSDGKL